MIVYLYTTAGCHLCEQALAMLQALQTKGHDMEICEVEISASESLMAAYGIRIPVITTDKRTDDLGWPFTTRELEAFINN
ncbi:MAG: glutaredoxin family protein [Pseudomonadales bacterium]